MSERKLTLTLDFDGVLHSYTSGWKGADVIPDPPVPGAIEFLREALKHFKVCVCSSRCVDGHTPMLPPDDQELCQAVIVAPQPNFAGIEAMYGWLQQHGLTTEELQQIEFWVAKPPSHVMIDDRAMTFDGPHWYDRSWHMPSGAHGQKSVIEMLKAFQPWNYRSRH